MKTIVITGGIGYIGSHIADKLLESSNYNIVILDNAKDIPDTLTKRWENFVKIGRLNVYTNFDLTSITKTNELYTLIYNWGLIECVIHCAALKSVPESVDHPLLYYEKNILMTINLLKWMTAEGIYNLIYSSSASVYGSQTQNLLSFINQGALETDKLKPESPYGSSKMMCEMILEDVCRSNENMNVISLRYFNPAGTNFTVDQGDSNLFTAIKKCIASNSPLKIFGNDYGTKDGTCIRDYIHIDDLVDGHISAIKYIGTKINSNYSYSYNYEDEDKDEDVIANYEVFNLGSKCGYSTLEVALALKSECEKNDILFNYVITERRSGDADIIVANCDKAMKLWNWSPKLNLSDICKNIVAMK